MTKILESRIRGVGEALHFGAIFSRMSADGGLGLSGSGNYLWAGVGLDKG